MKFFYTDNFLVKFPCMVMEIPAVFTFRTTSKIPLGPNLKFYRQPFGSYYNHFENFQAIFFFGNCTSSFYGVFFRLFFSGIYLTIHPVILFENSIDNIGCLQKFLQKKIQYFLAIILLLTP